MNTYPDVDVAPRRPSESPTGVDDPANKNQPEAVITSPNTEELTSEPDDAQADDPVFLTEDPDIPQTQKERKGEVEEKGDNPKDGDEFVNMDGKGDNSAYDVKANGVEETASTEESRTTTIYNTGASDKQLSSTDREPGLTKDTSKPDTEPSASENDPVNPESKYEDDFSEMSEASGCGATVSNGADPTPAVSEPAASKSPVPSSNDEGRAEAAAVVPVAAPLKHSDGKSLAEERGEVRGEDRTEVQVDEGQDCRGQGGWKSEDELFLESSLMNQHAEKEALQASIDEKMRIQKDYDNLKGRYVALEKSSKKWEENVSILNQAMQEQTLRIKELETEVARLKRFEQWGADNESKVKDLQDRLGALAGEDADKDRHIQKLQEDLQETRSRLVASERLVAANNEAALQLQQRTQQTKTCTII